MSGDQEALQDETIKEAWRLMHEVLTTGKATLQTGEIRTTTTGGLLRLAQYAANLKPPRMRRLPDLDFQPARTHAPVREPTQAEPA